MTIDEVSYEDLVNAREKLIETLKEEMLKEEIMKE